MTTLDPDKHSWEPLPEPSPEKLTVLEAAKVVKDPLEALVAPMAVLLIPVAVVLKSAEVMPKTLAPNPQVELAPAVKFKAPAELRDRVPEVVVDKVNGPESTVSVKPPVEGPVIVLAETPEKVTLPP